jgi:hypothetical protein
MMPEMVLATPVPKIHSATKLKNAAHSTASRGDSTRVETMVAIELAASWNPLMTSNARAAAIVTTTTVETSMAAPTSARGSRPR